MQLTIHDLDAAPSASQPLLKGIAEDLGLVPNMAAVIAESSTLLTVFDAMRRAVGSAALDPVHREVAGLAVGVAVDNAYGVAFHSVMLGNLGVADRDIDAMRSGRGPADPTLTAVYTFSRDLVLTRGKVDDAVVARTIEAGLSAEGVLEIVAECTFAGLVGTMDNLAGRVPLDEFLAPRAWR